MHDNKKHVVLIGMPASGKSTVGVLAAKETGFRFVDSDLVIQERQGRKLHEIISSEGNNGFLKIEEDVNLSLCSINVPTIIATGGSAIYSEPAMKRFKETGTVVYLRLPYETVKERLGNFTHRGVVMPEGYTLQDLYNERCALCERYADIIIDEAPDGNISDVVQDLCAALTAENHSNK